MITINGTYISNSLVIQYYNKLIGKIYTILPIFEGSDYQTKKITVDPYTAYDNFQKHVDKLIIEICGSNSIFMVNVYSIELLSVIRGIKEIDIADHSKVRSSVLNCINLCKNIIFHMESEPDKHNDETESDAVGI